MGVSGRGGARTGGGRPSPWQHQPTCTISCLRTHWLPLWMEETKLRCTEKN